MRFDIEIPQSAAERGTPRPAAGGTATCGNCRHDPAPQQQGYLCARPRSRLELAVRGSPHRIPETVTGQYIEYRNPERFRENAAAVSGRSSRVLGPACDAWLIGTLFGVRVGPSLFDVEQMDRRACGFRRRVVGCSGNAMAPDDSSGPTEATASEIERQAALDRLSKDAFDLGLYDRKEMPEGCTDD